MTNNKAIKGKAGAGGEGTGRKEALRAMDEAARGAGDVCTGSIHPPAIKEQGKETLPMACSISAIVASYSGNDAPDDEGHGPTVVHVSGMAAHLVGLAHGQAVRFANYRRAVGREVTPSDLEEFEATYRAAFTRAAMQTGVLPAAFRWLWAKKGVRNPDAPERVTARAMGWRAVLAWRREWVAGFKQVGRYARGGGAECYQFISLASQSDLESLVAHFGGAMAEPEAHETGDSGGMIDADACINKAVAIRTRGNSGASRIEAERVRRWTRHAQWSLRAYWMTNAGQKWRAGYASDCSLVRAIALLCRGNGLEALAKTGRSALLAEVSENGRYSPSDALRSAVCRLRKTLAAGDLLLQLQPDAVANAVILRLGVKRGGAAVRELVDREILPGLARPRFTEPADEQTREALEWAKGRARAQRAMSEEEAARAVLLSVRAQAVVPSIRDRVAARRERARAIVRAVQARAARSAAREAHLLALADGAAAGADLRGGTGSATTLQERGASLRIAEAYRHEAAQEAARRHGAVRVLSPEERERKERRAVAAASPGTCQAPDLAGMDAVAFSMDNARRAHSGGSSRLAQVGVLDVWQFGKREAGGESLAVVLARAAAGAISARAASCLRGEGPGAEAARRARAVRVRGPLVGPDWTIETARDARAARPCPVLSAYALALIA